MQGQYKSSWITFSQAVEKTKCQLVDATIVATSAGAAAANIYDGPNATGKKIGQLATPASDMRELSPRQPIDLENGLYIELGSNVAGVLIVSRIVE